MKQSTYIHAYAHAYEQISMQIHVCSNTGYYLSVQVTQCTDSWPSYSALRFGFTSIDPWVMAASGLPNSAVHTRGVCWAVRETSLHEDIALSPGAHLVYWRSSDGDMHIDLEDKAGGFSEIQRGRVCDGDSIWAVMHVCGSTGQIVLSGMCI